MRTREGGAAGRGRPIEHVLHAERVGEYEARRPRVEARIELRELQAGHTAVDRLGQLVKLGDGRGITRACVGVVRAITNALVVIAVTIGGGLRCCVDCRSNGGVVLFDRAVEQKQKGHTCLTADCREVGANDTAHEATWPYALRVGASNWGRLGYDLHAYALLCGVEGGAGAACVRCRCAR